MDVGNGEHPKLAVWRKPTLEPKGYWAAVGQQRALPYDCLREVDWGKFRVAAFVGSGAKADLEASCLADYSCD
jgi:hypothetical protein